MKKAKSSISKARSYSEIGEFWDENDSSDFWKKTRRVKFDVGSRTGNDLLSYEKKLYEKIQSEARKQGGFF